MFYRTDEPHGLPHDPFKSCVVPRPIGWITSLDPEGRVNLAPYSFFNAVAADPPMVMFTSNGPAARPSKDSVMNIEATGEFVCSIATWDLREAMNRTSAGVPHGEDEMAMAGLEPAPSELVKPPRVKASPIHLECRHHQTVDLPCTLEGGRNALVIGHVVGIHIADEVLVDGKVDIPKIRPIARLGYMDYAVVDEIFAMQRPKA